MSSYSIYTNLTVLGERRRRKPASVLERVLTVDSISQEAREMLELEITIRYLMLKPVLATSF